jgi:hypothetical protein
MTRRTIELAAFFTVLLIASLAFHAWIASHDDQLRLQSTLAAQKQLLDAADARERTRTATLDQSLAEIAEIKRSAQTPQQILRELPKYLPLPQPITPETMSKTQQGTARSEKPPAAINPPLQAMPPSTSGVSQGMPAAQIPSSDLKPLFDFVQDCRACQAQLAAAKQNSLDDRAKIDAITRERNAAIQASKGGSFLRRLRRDALWFAVGAGLGVAAGFAACKR